MYGNENKTILFDNFKWPKYLCLPMVCLLRNENQQWKLSWLLTKNVFYRIFILPNFTLYAKILFVLLLLQKFCLSCLWWGLMMSLSNRKRPWNVRPGMIDWRHQLTDFSRKTHRIVSNCLGGILMFCQLSNPDGLVSQTKVK